jgi:hypothetical protein
MCFLHSPDDRGTLGSGFRGLVWAMGVPVGFPVLAISIRDVLIVDFSSCLFPKSLLPSTVAA